MTDHTETLKAIQDELASITATPLGRTRLDLVPIIIDHVERHLDEIQRLIDRALEGNP